jgi:CheY-like chemotaxis protein
MIAADAYPAETSAARHQPQRTVPDDPSASCPAVSLEGVHVLIVDDEQDARALVERLLKECAATVTTAASAREALAHVERDKPDVLVSDIGMPEHDGYALIRWIRRLEGERGEIPAIAFTAYARPEDRAKAIQAGYQLHLAKPVEPMRLVSMVASLVKRPTRTQH